MGISSDDSSHSVEPAGVRPRRSTRPGALNAADAHDVRSAQDAHAAEPNLLLARIPAHEYALLHPHLEPFRLEPMQILAEAGERLSHVYFPHSGIVSMLRRLSDGTLIETATVGREGMAGVAIAAGIEWAPVMVAGEVPGACERIDATTFRGLLPQLEQLGALLLRYSVALTSQVGHALACNSLHSVEQRCARWLLMTHDRVGGDEFVLTQEILAQMLAVRRAGVSEAATAFQRAGLITYSRGRLTILDRAGLESVACECYRAQRNDFERLLGG